MDAITRIQGTVMPLDRADIDTDQIMPKQFLTRAQRTGFGEFVFFEWRKNPSFEMNARQYAGAQILVTGRNFGCGSSREHAPIAIKAAGISCVIAKSFARIFYRNAFNMGLPIFESAELWMAIKEGDEISLDSSHGRITTMAGNKTFNINPIPPFMEQLIADGGLMKHLAKKPQ